MVPTSEELLAALAVLGIEPPAGDETEWTVTLGCEADGAGVTAVDAVKVYAEETERDQRRALRTAARLREQLQEAEAHAAASGVATSEEFLAALDALGIRPPAPGEIEWTVLSAGVTRPAGVTPLDAVRVCAEELEQDERAALRVAARLREQLQLSEARAQAYRAARSEELLAALAFLGIEPPADGAIEWTVALAGGPQNAGVTALDAVKVYAEEVERDERVALRAAARLREQLQEAEARTEEPLHELLARLQENALWFRERGNRSHARLCEAANHAIVKLASQLTRTAA